MNYQSVVHIESKTLAGVRFSITRMSFGRRLELTKRVRELSQQQDFFQAGKDVTDRLNAALVSAEIDRVYLSWGLAGVEGLEIDGMKADAESILERAPEAFSREVIAAVRAECGLTAEERKN
jgi:hypothetical protein